jgi:hypothetical protein
MWPVRPLLSRSSRTTASSGCSPKSTPRAGQRPRPRLGLVGSKAAQEDPVFAVEADRVAPEARSLPLAGRGCGSLTAGSVTGRGARRESARSSARKAGTRITHDKAHRLTDGAVRAAIRRAAYSNRAVAPGTPARARTRRPWRRTGGAWPGRRRGALPICRGGPRRRPGRRSSAGNDRAMQSLTGERVEEPAASPTDEPRWSRRVWSRDGRAGLAPATRSRRCASPPTRGIRRRTGGTIENRYTGDDSSAIASAPSAARRAPQAPAEARSRRCTRPPGNRGDSDVAVAEHCASRASARGSPARSSRWKVRPTRGASWADRATRAAGRRSSCRRRPRPRAGRCVLEALLCAHTEHRSRARPGPRPRPGARPPTRPRARARLVEERRIERRAVEPDRLPVAVRRSEGDPCGCLHAQCRDGPGNPASVASSSPTRRSAAIVAGDANTPQARQRYAGLRSNKVTCRPTRGQQRRDDCPGRPAADDRDVRFRHVALAEEPVCLPGRDHRVALTERGRSAIDRLQPGPAQQPLDSQRASRRVERTAAKSSRV